MEEFELEPGEQITQAVRRHWIVLIYNLLPFIVLAIIPLLIPWLIHVLSDTSPALGQSVSEKSIQLTPWLRLVLAFYWLFLWMGAFASYTRYTLTVWIITSTRIVDIHQYGFFNRQVSSFLLNRVQDVTTSVDGFLPTIFGFGTLNVETAGREEKFQMGGISHPTELRDLIMREVAALHADGAPFQGSTGV